VTAIARHLGISEPGFRSHYLRADGRTLLDGLGNRCVFLAEDTPAACTIYPVRPERCRTWPFWPELLDSPAQLVEAMRLCPGIEKTE
jgi:Fe-S-cluster containining protein